MGHHKVLATRCTICETPLKYWSCGHIDSYVRLVSPPGSSYRACRRIISGSSEVITFEHRNSASAAGLVGPIQKMLDQLGLLRYFSEVYGNIGDAYGQMSGALGEATRTVGLGMDQWLATASLGLQNFGFPKLQKLKPRTWIGGHSCI